MRPNHDPHRVPCVALAPLIQAWLDDHTAQHPRRPETGLRRWVGKQDFVETGALDSFADRLTSRSERTKETWLRLIRSIVNAATNPSIKRETVGFAIADEIVTYGLENPWLWHSDLAEHYWPVQLQVAA